MENPAFALLAALLLAFSAPFAQIDSDDDCPTSCINGKVYEMVYTGNGMCQVENLNPIEVCQYGCVEDNPYVGCASGPSGSSGDSSPVPQPSPQPAPQPQASCEQPGAQSTSSGCKVDPRCASGCTGGKFQLAYPSCTCFEADFGDKLVLVMGPSMRIVESDSGQEHTGGKHYLGIDDSIETSDSAALMIYPDGTYFRLAPESRVEVDFEGFFLREGGCWVKVEKGEEREFYIKMETLLVGAIGTAFYAWADGTEEGVRALEGMVLLRVQDGSQYPDFELAAGSEAVFSKGDGELNFFTVDEQEISMEYEEFTENSGNMLTAYGNRGENDLCCTPALVLLMILLPATLIKK
jgi:hypothetical protein